MENIFTHASISVSEFKANPIAAIEQADGPVALLHRNKPIAYLIPAQDWEAICNRLEDDELTEIVKARSGQGAVSVRLEDL